MWRIFNDEIKCFKLKLEVTETMKKIKDIFESNAEYKKIIEAKLEGCKNILNHDIYNMGNDGKIFF